LLSFNKIGLAGRVLSHAKGTADDTNNEFYGMQYGESNEPNLRIERERVPGSQLIGS